MDVKEIKKAVAKIQTALFKNSNSYSIGMLRSHFKGTGLQFKEHQIYTHGDDVRFIDWKLLAKTKIPYVKTFDEERNVEIAVVIDASPTMFSGFNDKSKLEASIELLSLLYLLAKETGDKVHVTILANDVINIAAASGEAGIVSLISSLSKAHLIDEKGKINICYDHRENSDEIQKKITLTKHLAKKREIVVFSDFNNFLDLEFLKRLLYKKNVHCFQITSPLDEAEKIPYLLHLRSTKDDKNGILSQVRFSGNKNLDNFFGKKLKRLKVHDRYLETFIKEMV